MCFLDQALYAKAAEIIWKHSNYFKHTIIIRLGVFHTHQGRIQGGFVGFGRTPLITNCTIKVFKLALNTSKVGFWEKQIIKNDYCLLFSYNFIIRLQLQSSASIVSCCDHRKMTGSLFFLWAELATGAHFAVD